MIKAAIMGGSGCRAGELVRLIINHPDVNLLWAYSLSHAGAAISDIHRGLVGECDMTFTDKADLDGVDVLFSCLPQGKLREFLDGREISESLRIIDITGDFRHDGADSGFTYGLPELNRKALVRGATKASTPSPAVHAAALGLLPLAKNLLLNSPIEITGVTASTDSSLGNNFVNEISDAMAALQASFNAPVTVDIKRGDFARGTAVTIKTTTTMSTDSIRRLFDDFYDDHNFTFIVNRPVDILDVANTNKALIYIDKDGDTLTISTVIDNIVKGSSGNAIHCMNLLFGLHERTGLCLKASAY